MATQRLKQAAIENPHREARLLAAHHLGLDQAALLMADAQTLDLTSLEPLITRRAAQEPLAYLTGTKGFWKHDFNVTPDTLIPRPETELLVEQGIATNPARILDLGTGTGCILLSILADCRRATGIGTDISKAALKVAQQNADHLNLTTRAQFIATNWTTDIQGPFDLILSNPPYITSNEYQNLHQTVRNYEPQIALTPGNDGLNAYRTITTQTPNLLTKGGHLILEIGATQGKAVSNLLTNAGFRDVKVLQDLAGLDRCVKGRWQRT